MEDDTVDLVNGHCQLVHHKHNYMIGWHTNAPLSAKRHAPSQISTNTRLSTNVHAYTHLITYLAFEAALWCTESLFSFQMKVMKSHGAIAACLEAWPQCRPSPAARPVSCSRPTPPSHPSCSMDNQTNQSEAPLCSAALRRLPTLCTIRLSSTFLSAFTFSLSLFVYVFPSLSFLSLFICSPVHLLTLC